MYRREFIRMTGAGAAMLWFDPSSALMAQPKPAEGSRAGDEQTIEGIRVCWCPAGRFTMGSPASESGHRPDEAQAPVTITRGFWMGKFEVTQSQWRTVMSRLPERAPSAEFGLGDEMPVYWVSFTDAESFCRRLTALARRSGSLSEAQAFRIPSEAQWEYACRAGTVTATAFGDAFGRDHANFSGEPLNGGRGGDAPGRATVVGSYRPNAWGLCDMHGNIFEWCRDWYHARLPGGTDPDLSTVKGVANRDGTYSRVRRGGAWNDPGWSCRSAMRLRYEPERSSDHIGFRVAVTAPPPSGL